MKKILYINDFDNGGGAEIIFNQTYNLFKDDFTCEKFIGSNSYTSSTNIFKYIFNYSFYRKIKKKLVKFKPDVIHLNNFYHFLTPSILLAILRYKRNNNVRVIMTVHDFHICFPNSGFHFFKNGKIVNLKGFPTLFELLSMQIDHRGFIYGFLKKVQWILAYKVLNLSKSLDLLICPSFFIKNYMDLYFKGKIATVLLRNPFNLRNLALTSKCTEIDNTIKLVYVGRISNEKGLKEFIHNLVLYSGSYRFDIIGTGDDKYISEINLMIKDNCYINMLGFKHRNEILEILGDYDVLVLCSLLYENFPTVMLEASAKNLQIITCNYGGMKELGLILGNTFFFEFSDPETLQKALSDCEKNKYNIITRNEDFFDDISEARYKEKLLTYYKF